MVDFNNILNNNILSIIIWLPIVTGILILLINNKYFSKLVTPVGLINFILSLWLLKNFNITTHVMQFVEHYQLLPDFGICYSLGVDGFSVLIISLSCFVNVLTLIVGLHNNTDYRYLVYFIIMNGLINGVLTSNNALLFYMFFETTLIPLYLIIGIWGGENRIYAATKFFLYTFAGSVLFLIAIVFLYSKAITAGVEPVKSLELQSFYWLKLSLQEQIYLFVAFLIAFGIKIPIVPLHTWLPDAHVEAPTGGSVILAAITLKLGAFAMLRFLLPIATAACLLFSKFIIFTSLLGIIYIGFISFVPKDIKKLIAYSSIAHMGFVTMGIFLVLPLIKDKSTDLAIASLNGALVQILSHGLIAAGLFFSAGFLYNRANTNQIKDFSGIANVMPVFSILFMIFCMANIALPGTCGFVGEFLIILASFKYNSFIAAGAASSLILAVSYTLGMYKKVIFGAINININYLQDLDFKETVALISIALLIILFGVWPAPVLDILNNSTLNLIKIMESK